MGWSGLVRMIPVGGARKGWAGSPCTAVARRYYEASPGQTVDVLADDVSTLTSQGFAVVAPIGPTAGRPNDRYLTAGFQMIDTDLSLMICWDGASWRNPVTGEAV